MATNTRKTSSENTLNKVSILDEENSDLSSKSTDHTEAFNPNHSLACTPLKTASQPDNYLVYESITLSNSFARLKVVEPTSDCHSAAEEDSYVFTRKLAQELEGIRVDKGKKITSPTGATIRDIFDQLQDKVFRLHQKNARLQGESAEQAKTIAILRSFVALTTLNPTRSKGEGTP